jgi:hypothetical protein
LTIAQYSELSARISALEKAVSALQEEMSELRGLLVPIPKRDTLHIRKKDESRRAIL